MNKNYKISENETLAIIIVITINKLILNIPFYIIQSVGSGTLVNIIYIGLIDFIFLLLILKLMNKFENQDIIDIAEFLGGNILKTIIAFISIGLLFLASYITILDFSNVLHTIYFSSFDLIYILLYFIIGILIANLSGLKSIASASTFISFFAIISIIITFLNTQSSFDITKITPLFGLDFKTTFLSGLSNTFAIYSLVYIYFFKPLLKHPENFKKISIKSFIFSFIILLTTSLSMLTIFSSTLNIEPINSLFVLARQIEFGNFLQRIDALFIFIWIISIFSYLSFTIFLISKILKKLFNFENEKDLSYSLCSILLGLTLIPINIPTLHYIEKNIYKNSIIIFIFVIGFLVISLANLKSRKAKK